MAENTCVLTRARPSSDRRWLGTGISALITGPRRYARPPANERRKKEKLRNRYATVGVEIPVARDGLSVYVNASNPLTEITMDQLKLIFTGKVPTGRNWAAGTGRFVLYSRENSSGTYVFFKGTTEEADYTVRAQSMPGTAAWSCGGQGEVRIGYGARPTPRHQVLKVKQDAGSPAIASTRRT